MNEMWRRVGLSVAGGGTLLAGYAVLYRWGMATFEGERLSYVRALQVVLEALTTAGFGGDAPWHSTGMNLLVVGMNLTGVLLVFFAIPFFMVPLLEDAIETDVPTTTDLSGHVVVAADSAREDALRRELEGTTAPSLFVESDVDAARELLREGAEVIHGSPDAAGTLRSANLPSARALVVDLGDETNANVILTARRLCPDLHIVSVVEDADAESYHEYAGADEVVRPRVVAAERLAEKALGSRIGDALSDATETDSAMALTEVVIEAGSDLAGTTLAASGLREHYGLTVVGGWFHGEFVAPVDPSRVLGAGTVLLAVGTDESLQTRPHRPIWSVAESHAAVVGYGVVGRTATEQLSAAGVDVSAVDVAETEGVDVVGDATESTTMERAAIGEADAVVVTLDRDSRGVYSTLVAREDAPSTPILARADEVESVQRFYDAGADYVLSLSRVTAHMVTASLFAGDDGRSADKCTVRRITAPNLVRRRLGDADLRAQTGVSVVAVERDRRVIESPGPDFRVEADDVLIVAGHHDAVAEFGSEPSGAEGRNQAR